MSVRLLVLVAIPVIALSVRASAQSCTDEAIAQGIVSLGDQAGFGDPVPACARNSVGLKLRGGLVIDTPDFYGRVAASGSVSGAWNIDERWSVAAQLDALTWRYAVNAVVESTGLGFGPASVSARHSVALGESADGLAYLRLLLPVDTSRQNSVLMGAEVGLSAQRRMLSWLQLQGAVTVPLTLSVVDGQRSARFIPAVLGEAALAWTRWLAFTLGAVARFAAPQPGLSSFAPRVGALISARGFTFELASEIPVAGADRSDIAISALVGFAGF